MSQLNPKLTQIVQEIQDEAGYRGVVLQNKTHKETQTAEFQPNNFKAKKALIYCSSGGLLILGIILLFKKLRNK